jgi:hypothetical protein
MEYAKLRENRIELELREPKYRAVDERILAAKEKITQALENDDNVPVTMDVLLSYVCAFSSQLYL